MNMQQSLKINAFGIGCFATITAALIAVTFVLTKAPIEENVRRQKTAKLYEIIPTNKFDNDLFTDTVELEGTEFGYSQNISAHVATVKGRVTTIIFPVRSSQGYSGDISLLVGINADTSIAGVRVITHTETPGLGDKLELKKSPWLHSFTGLKKVAEQPWAVKKDGGQFDQFTGATITPRAVVNAVGKSLDYFHKHRQRLLDPSVISGKNSSGETNNGN
ncbi:electron transporter RnfG ['Osedax' symbiont bacterium Rs2_46_30_T18]|nr:electron transporter RnfG ['Osedax' symbiont bacterium Rs2_46_30_T18]